MRVYFNEFNVMMGKVTYLPLASGLLHAFAEQNERLRCSVQFMPYLFCIDEPDTILSQYREPPDVAAFSVSMWNEQLSLMVAKELKRRHPDCLIIFGGAQAPHNPEDFFVEHPFVDLIVRGEGEEAFQEILLAHLDAGMDGGRAFDEIPGVVWRDPDTGACRSTTNKRAFERDMAAYPSPYLEGYYTELMAANPDMDFQVIMETNRGCPFQCTFCYWGKGGLSRKYRYHTMERVKAEVTWCGKNKIRYVFNADSNFGMHKRDMEIAKMIVETKKIYGAPEKFRTCYGKNTDEKIFAIGKLFHAYGLEKGITLSRQSNELEVQKNIRRDNIDLETYKKLQTQFNEEKIPVYSEMILGLPGETLETWTHGVAELLRSGLKNQLFIYLLQVYPNTALGSPEYQEEFGLILRDQELNEIHCTVRPKAWVPEVETIVVGSHAMTTDQWEDGLIFSWTTMLFHSLKSGFYLMFYISDHLGADYRDFLLYLSQKCMSEGKGALLREQLTFFYDKIKSMEGGAGRGCVVTEAGNIYWDVEETAFLNLSRNFDQFYEEMFDVVLEYLELKGIDHDPDQVQEMIIYQRLRMPTPDMPLITQWAFQHNFPEYFEAMFKDKRVPLVKEPQRLTVSQEDFAGDLQKYAEKTILFGRKSDLMVRDYEWEKA